MLEVRWPSGQVDTFKDLPVDKLYIIEEGSKSPKSQTLIGIKGK